MVKGHFIFNLTITFYNIIQQRSLWKIKQNYAIGDLNGNDIDRMICKIILSHAKLINLVEIDKVFVYEL